MALMNVWCAVTVSGPSMLCGTVRIASTSSIWDVSKNGRDLLLQNMKVSDILVHCLCI